MGEGYSTSPIEPSDSSRILRQEQAEGAEELLAQVASEISMIDFAEEAAFNPVMMARRFQTLEERLSRKEVDKKQADKTEGRVVPVEEIEKISNEFEQRNPELHAKALRQLLALLKERDTKEEILRKVMQNYPDHSLADESLEFLEQTATGNILEKVRAAKEDLNQTFGREVKAGRNIANQAREFSQKGLGSPTGLRDLYRDITGNPREAATLFSELNEKFTYDNMKTTIDFLLHSLGSDLKSKGPSIAPGELHRLMTEVRNLLAILWVYRFFRGRIDLITAAFERGGMLLPTRVTFEMLAKMFVQFLLERYPSMDKVFQLALKMGFSANTIAQIIIFGQMRDAVRGVAPKLFRGDQHRRDVLMSFIEALDELEEQLDKEEEEKKKEEQEEDGDGSV